jgi:hypothetical protein
MAEVIETQHGPVVLREPTTPTTIRHVPAPIGDRERRMPEGHTMRLGGGLATAGELRALGYQVDPRLGDDEYPTAILVDSLPLPDEVRLVQVPGQQVEWAGEGAAPSPALQRQMEDRDRRVRQRFVPEPGLPATPADATAPPPAPAEAVPDKPRGGNGGNGK